LLSGDCAVVRGRCRARFASLLTKPFVRTIAHNNVADGRNGPLFEAMPTDSADHENRELLAMITDLYRIEDEA
jgi:hypothetical protein